MCVLGIEPEARPIGFGRSLWVGVSLCVFVISNCVFDIKSPISRQTQVQSPSSMSKHEGQELSNGTSGLGGGVRLCASQK